MVELRYNGWGPNVKCENCKQDIVLESKTNYEKCVNCGFAYVEPPPSKDYGMIAILAMVVVMIFICLLKVFLLI